LVVDDSAVARRLFVRGLASAPEIQVAGEASDAYVARDAIVRLQPDVLVLDVEMPRMNGIAFLRRLMRHYPMPVVVCSSSAVAGGDTALRALEAGAVDVICKPNDNYSAQDFTRDLVSAVRNAASTRTSARPARSSGNAGPPAPRLAKRTQPGECRLIVIGASTGGTVAVESIVRALPPSLPPLVIVQHLPAYITQAFARRLAGLTQLSVEEARDASVLRHGTALVAPGGKHVVIESVGDQLRVGLRDGPKVNGHRPAVDVLFRSAAEAAGECTIGILLTGMGKDGAEGLLSLHVAGAHTFAQDEASSAVWGMPKAAIQLGAADEIVALDDIANRLTRAAQQRAVSATRKQSQV
jgi:two-component system chemotaxis response regulator CheB